MLHGLVTSARQLIDEVRRSWFLGAAATRPEPPVQPPAFAPLERIVVTDGVGRTLFEQFANHRGGPTGKEETGWLLLGLREARQAVCLATLPAGARSDAGVAHIRFNAEAQAVGSQIVRLADRRLTILGVVHTHPGSLRHPSDGDLRGDRVWVRNLRGQEGVFGIGTADAPKELAGMYAQQPRPNVQCLGTLRFSWYSLRLGEQGYRPLPVEMTLGPDLARSLYPAWPTLEEHAERLERLIRQQAGLQVDIVHSDPPALSLRLPLAGRDEALRVLLSGTEVRYYVERGGDLFAAHPGDDRIDRGVYLLLAELAGAP